MKKVAKLVLVSFMTRVVVEESASEAEILDAARPFLLEKVKNELGGNLESIETDEECPFGTFNSDR